MSSILHSIGKYQLVVLLSRGIGFFRDALILLVLGATAASDTVFFLVGFADFLTLLIAGGGVALYLSQKLQSDFTKVYISATFFYFLLAIILVVFELSTSAALGSFLYAGLLYDESSYNAYIVSIVGLVFTFPLAASYAVFVSDNKIFLQPVMNIVYTLCVVFSLLYYYLVGKFFVEGFAYFLLIAMLIRFLVATVISNKIKVTKSIFLKLHNDYKFYLDMLFSGLSVGVIVAVPFAFRGYLPVFGEGVYATSALVFKISDMLLALVLVPVCTVVLNKYNVAFKWIVGLLSLAVFCSLAVIVLYYVIFSTFPSLGVMLSKHDYNIEVVELSIWASLVTSLSYVLGMIHIKLGNKFVLFFCSLILMFLVRQTEYSLYGSDIEGYFYSMYSYYALFIVIVFSLLLRSILIMNKENH